MQHVRPRLLVLLLLLATTSCGERNDVVDPAASLTGPPLWRLDREGGPDDEAAFTLRTRTPGRVRFRFEGTGHLERASAWRDLAGGQTVRILWTVTVEEADPAMDTPGAADRAAGRTEPHVGTLTFGFSDMTSARERHVLFSRPGKGRVLSRSLLPPGKYEPLALDGPVELATLVFTDLERGAATLRSRGTAARLTLPEDMGPEDRVETMRVVLEVELRAEGGGP